MSETDFEFPEFATAYSKDAREMRDKLPDDARHEAQPDQAQNQQCDHIVDRCGKIGTQDF